MKATVEHNALSRPAVSVAIPVRADDCNLESCLRTLADFSDVVVVDSGHSEATCAIATKYGARYYSFDFRPPFPKKRNWALDNVEFEHEWVLFLDADERMTKEFSVELRAITAPDNLCVAYWVRYRNYFMNRELRFGVPQQKLSLFRKSSARYERIDDPGWSSFDMEIHEHPIASGRIGKMRTMLDHRDFRPVLSLVVKHVEYAKWEAGRAEMLYDAEGPKGAILGRLTFRQQVKYRMLTTPALCICYFIFAYFLRLGFLDGRAGLNYAVLKSAYFAQVYLLLSDRRRREPGDL